LSPAELNSEVATVDSAEPGWRLAARASFTTLPRLEPAPASLLDYLEARFPRIARPIWLDRLERGLIQRLDGSPLPFDAAYEPELKVQYFRDVVNEPEASDRIELLFLDDHLAVVDKPAFLAVAPTGDYLRRTALWQLEEMLGQSDLAPLHRLDRLTAGLVLFARRPAERGAYAQLFATNKIEKVYEALVKMPMRPDTPSCRFESRIEDGEPFFLSREVEGSVNAITDAELIDWQDGVGHLRLFPRTGKKHQLRVHLNSRGWPILNDPLYPELRPRAEDDRVRPLALVARSLRFCDPLSGSERFFVSRMKLKMQPTRS
jgi:tRNA pseudouridine32 synthase / 23S rRNA pseudouridine746 synthase